MRGSARWRSRWRSSAVWSGGAVGLALLYGCGGQDPPSQPVAIVGGLVLEAVVVEQLAAREGLSPDQAQARAVDTLRLVAAGRQQHAERGADPGPPLVPRRAEHLRRAARARLWLSERFEPEHRPADIPADEPRLVRARQDRRLVHPEIHVVCQVVVEPPDVEALADKAVITADPAWRERALLALAPVLARIERNVPVDDPEACRLVEREVELSGPGDDPHLRVVYPRPGGFHLDACADDPLDASAGPGACTQPQFDPEWTKAVRALPAPGRSMPFFTRFGLHVVHLEQRLPAQPADDPATELALRQAVHDAWRAEALDRRLEALGRAQTVRLAHPPEGAP
jgi:hypothetical protein